MLGFVSICAYICVSYKTICINRIYQCTEYAQIENICAFAENLLLLLLTTGKPHMREGGDRGVFYTSLDDRITCKFYRCQNFCTQRICSRQDVVKASVSSLGNTSLAAAYFGKYFSSSSSSLRDILHLHTPNLKALLHNE